MERDSSSVHPADEIIRVPLLAVDAVANLALIIDQDGGQRVRAQPILEIRQHAELDQQIEESRMLVSQADKKVDACLAEFNVATRDRQVIDRLKERKLEEAMLQEADVDRKTMDAVALTRFFRKEAGDSSR